MIPAFGSILYATEFFPLSVSFGTRLLERKFKDGVYHFLSFFFFVCLFHFVSCV